MKEYPLIVLNKETAEIAYSTGEYSCEYFEQEQIAYSADEYFEPEQGFWEVKCPVVDISKIQ